MTKNELLKTINDLLKKNWLYHSIIISNENQNELMDISIQISRQLFCENNFLENDSCVWCNKVLNGNNLNIFNLGDGVSKISKKDIDELIRKFSASGIEDNKNKLYIIFNGENLSEGASNSILKFLEEPPQNTFAIIFTRDRNQIISTIKSRCKFFILTSEQENEFSDYELVNLITNKNKNGVLEYLIEFKKKDKKEILYILEFTLKKIMKLNLTHLAEILLVTISEIKTSNYISLTLENFFINIYEVL